MIDLDELERLEREATPGPWKIAITKFPSGDSEWEYQLSTERGHAATPYSDFALIVAARNALPDLIAELRMLRAAHEERGEVQAAWAQGLRKAYEAGRLDALRGVQAAALYRHAELWLGRMRLTSADERRDIEACELAWAAAQAAEEIETQKGAGDDFDAMVRELRTLRARVAELEEESERLRWAVRASCVRTPTPGCDCPGCETARERATQVDLVESYEAELEEDRQAERDRILGARVREIARQYDARLYPYGFTRAVMRSMEESDGA